MEPEDKPLELSGEELAEIVGNVSESVGGEVKEALTAFVDAVFKKGVAPKDALGLTSAQMEGIYSQAYRLFNNGKYGEAKGLFRILVALDTLEPKYTMGLAACLHMQKEYELAIVMYLMSARQDPKNPIPMYHASDCFVKREEPIGAIWALKQVVDLCGDKEEYSIIKDRSLMTIKSLEEEAVSGTSKKEREEPEKK